MNESPLADDALDALLRASGADPLLDDGFVARTMVAVDQATHRLAVPRRATPVAPVTIARALVAENRRHAEQARMWRWAIAGVVVGFFLLVGVVALSPVGVSLQIPSPSQWGPLSLLVVIGAFSIAWREWRDN